MFITQAETLRIFQLKSYQIISSCGDHPRREKNELTDQILLLYFLMIHNSNYLKPSMHLLHPFALDKFANTQIGHVRENVLHIIYTNRHLSTWTHWYYSRNRNTASKIDFSAWNPMDFPRKTIDKMG